MMRAELYRKLLIINHCQSSMVIDDSKSIAVVRSMILPRRLNARVLRATDIPIHSRSMRSFNK